MDGTVPKIFYNFYLNFMNFLIFLNSRGPGSKFQISSGGARPLVRGGPAPWAPRQLRLWHVGVVPNCRLLHVM